MSFVVCLLLSLSCFTASSQADRHPLFYNGYDHLIKPAWEQYVPGLDWRWWKAQIYQESVFDTDAISPVGARGLCQAMPATFGDWEKALKWTGGNPHVAKYCIEGGAFYMAQLLRFPDWRPWSLELRLPMAQGGYNAGAGNIRKALRLCKGTSWATTAPCLVQVTGKHSAETITYVKRIDRWYKQLLLIPVRVAIVICPWKGHRGGCGPNR